MKNKKIWFCCLLLLCGNMHVWSHSVKEPVDYVNTLMGTDSKFALSNGNTYPAVAVPWGMNFWMPQTGKMGNGWAYTYASDKICGFKQTHQPSPWMNDYGQFSLMPMTRKLKIKEDDRASWFSHKAEKATPYYYSVYLSEYDITTEIAPTERCAHFRFTFPDAEQAYVVIDAFDRGSYVRVQPEKNRIIGYTTRNSGGVPANFKNYFVVEFDKPFTYNKVWAGGDIVENQLELKANHAGAVIGFATRRGEQVHARVASSFISPEQAERNLQEVAGKDFEQTKAAARAAWNETLGRIAVDDDDIEHLRTFYSCFYRSVLFPRMFFEYDEAGKPIHYSPYNGKVLPGYMFTDTGFWDTFRCLFPLLNLVFPSMNEKMQEGLANAYLESGFLPEWASPGHRDCMVGNNSAAVVADAWMKGVRGQDIEVLWEALKHGANAQLPRTASGRVAFEEYNRLGYVPSNIGVRHSAARTLEYAYNDWTIYTLGRALGKPAGEIAIYKERAMNYRNLFNPQYKLMVGKDDKGVFNPRFKGTDWSHDFCEGNSWHWSFCVFHDPQGLIDLMGGRDMFNTMMDSVFVMPGWWGMDSRGVIHEMREMEVMNMGQYAHGNQPIQHMPYLYNYSGQPWKTQYWVREIMDRLYLPTPDGYCGDEDNGQTSAWYVFSALGFYSVCPGTNQYVLGTPLFKSVELKLENGKSVRIQAPANSRENRYVDDLRLNGKRHTCNYLTHEQLMKGATLQYRMRAVPNTARNTDESAAPYSFSNE